MLKKHFRANVDRWNKVGPPPMNITPVKGSVHITVNRKFVEYIVHNSTAHEILGWLKRGPVPDEAYFSTLNYNPQLNIPGAYKGGLSLICLHCTNIICFLVK